MAKKKSKTNNSKNKKNAYSFFVQEQARKTGMTMLEAYKVCAKAWEDLDPEIRQGYKEMETASKGHSPLDGKAVAKYDSYGIDVSHHHRRQQDEEMALINMVSWINKTLMNRRGPVTSALNHPINCNQVYVIGHLNIHCRTRHEELVPAEIGLVKFSLSEGCIDSYHCLLHLKNIPVGYQFATKQHVEKTHNLPFNNDTEIGERDAKKVGLAIGDFVGEEPIFIISNETENMQIFLSDLEDLVPEIGDIRLFDLALLLGRLEELIAEVTSDTVGRVQSVSAAESLLEEDPFLYRTKVYESCRFHHALENVKHCSLSIAKRRVYCICDQSARSLGVGLMDGKHLPFTANREHRPNDEDDFYQSRGVVKEFVNVFGTSVPRCGTMGGHIFTNPEMDPAPVMKKELKEKERKDRETMAQLAVPNADRIRMSLDRHRRDMDYDTISNSLLDEESYAVNDKPKSYKDALASVTAACDSLTFDECSDECSVASSTGTGKTRRSRIGIQF